MPIETAATTGLSGLMMAPLRISNSSRSFQTAVFKKGRGGAGRSELVETLAKLRGLAGLPLRKLHVLAEQMRIRLFRRDALIYEESQRRQYMYILLSGLARLTCLNRKGEWVLLEVLGPGDVVAIPSLLPGVRSNLRFRAFTECRIGLLSPIGLVQDIMGLPFGHFRHALGLTSGRWWQLLVRHSAFMEQSLSERVVLALLDLGSKIGVQDPRKRTLSLDLTHQDLAHLVMGSRAKVSACLGQLATQSAIVQQGRTRIITNPQKLQAIGGFSAPDM
jgi:CRP-like cAMP-binding protein